VSYYTDPLVTLHIGDCLEVLATLEADSVDAVVTDPPYGLEFMGKGWDAFRPTAVTNRGGRAPGRSQRDDTKFAPVAYGIGGRRSTMVCDGCGKRDKFTNPHGCPEGTGWTRLYLDADLRHAAYGQAFQAWCEQWGREALRVTKPGGYLLAFGGTRTHHRLVCALEDAGWIIRDELDWIYASGFPKGKSNLKPAHEPIVLARKPGPLRPLGIDECRIATTPEEREIIDNRSGGQSSETTWQGPPVAREIGEKFESSPAGRWPSNVLLSDPELFDQPNPYVVGSGATTTVPGTYKRNVRPDHFDDTSYSLPVPEYVNAYGDSGGYSRFFIIPKADRAERERGLAGKESEEELAFDDFNRNVGNTVAQRRANVHPTVKPIDLMRHLVRLVTPPGGVVLDPFLGSGTTCLAASEEGFRSIGIERELEYLEIAKGRLMATPMGLGLDSEVVQAPRKSIGAAAPASGPTLTGPYSGSNSLGKFNGTDKAPAFYGPPKQPRVEQHRPPGMFDEEPVI
jgi:DNA modification methylase